MFSNVIRMLCCLWLKVSFIFFFGFNAMSPIRLLDFISHSNCKKTFLYYTFLYIFLFQTFFLLFKIYSFIHEKFIPLSAFHMPFSLSFLYVYTEFWKLFYLLPFFSSLSSMTNFVFMWWLFILLFPFYFLNFWHGFNVFFLMFNLYHQLLFHFLLSLHLSLWVLYSLMSCLWKSVLFYILF